MPPRRNEQETVSRPLPLLYYATYDANSNVEYQGWTDRGSATSAAVWLIAKNTYSSGNLTKTEWASVGFDQIWDNRTSLTYA